MLEWTDYLIIAIFQCGITAGLWFLRAFFGKKGEDLATRQDIHEITKQIESAKTEYAKELESLKSQLNVKYHAHTVKFEKEFQVLQELWKCLVDLRNAGEAFTPGFKVGLADDDQCRARFAQTHNELLRVIDIQKPFFPQDIFELVDDYRKRFREYFVDHEFITGPHFREDMVSPDFWEKREENLDRIRKLIENVCMGIRKRAGDRLLEEE